MRNSASGVRAMLPTFGLADVPLFAAFALTYAAYAPRIKTGLRPSLRRRSGQGWTDFFPLIA